jgi:RNA polymerase sigma-70 factor (ECF subfamily)
MVMETFYPGNIMKSQNHKQIESACTYEEIYKKYHGKILNYLSRTIGIDDAEDMTQDVFLKVYKSLDNFNHESSIYTWIYRIATNCLIDKMRKKKIIDRCNLIDKILFCKTNPEYLTEEFKIIQNEMNECICSYIKILQPNYHTIIVLREYEMMSIDEIAYIMDINVTNAKKMLFRAKKKLRELLIKQCEFYYNEKNQLSCEKI